MKIEIKAKNQKWTLWIAIATLFIYVPFAIWGILEGDWFGLLWLYLPPFYFYLYFIYKKHMTGRYVQWDDEKLAYFMPYQKNKVSLYWQQIKKMDIKVLSIELFLESKVEKIDLNVVSYEDIQLIKRELPRQYHKIKTSNAA